MWNVRSTPTPKEILRTVKVSLFPRPRRLITTPSKTWMRSLSPSLTFMWILTVSPGRNVVLCSAVDVFFFSSNAAIIAVLLDFLSLRPRHQIGPLALRRGLGGPEPPRRDLLVIAGE